ncbi:hypothetical protein ACNJYD_07025 [Bradyrhizobium sp. DASA03005]|uniref:hypothetical protein n=1 Tax=Bradyrhizobium sp. SPXBL-02 TaxID=3395912 RepID=UPI003F727444
MTTIRSARTRIDLSTGTSGSNWLFDTRKIAFAVAEPRASLSDTLAGVVAGDLGDPVGWHPWAAMEQDVAKSEL